MNAHAQIEDLGWALLHSLWQGAALWLLLEAALAWPGLTSPRARGRLAGGALLLFVLSVAGTYGWLGREAGAMADTRVGAVAKISSESVPGLATETRVTDGMMGGAEVRGLGGDGAPPSNERGWRERVRSAMPWLVGAWAAGVALGLGRHARQWAALRRLRRVPLVELSPEWRDRFAALCARCAPGLGLPRIGETSLARVPQVLGGWAPVILLPAGFVAGLPAAQVEAVLAHELAHLVRRDFWLNVLQSVAEAVFFFHPAVHAFNSHIRRERERACDDLAVEWTRDSLGYARALATLAGALPSTPTAGSRVLAADGHEPGDLRARIGRLLGRPATSRVNWAPGGWLVIGALMAYAALFAASPVIVAQVMSPQERTKVVKEAMEAGRPRGGSWSKPVYPERAVTLVSELRTEDGTSVPERVPGVYLAANGRGVSSMGFEWVNGRASLKVPLGLASVLAVPEGWAPAVAYEREPVEGEGELVMPALTLRKGRPLTLRVRDEAGAPLADVPVSVRIRTEYHGLEHRQAILRTSADGLVILPHVAPEFVYELEATAVGRRTARRAWRGHPGAELVEWVLPKNRTITGRVVDAEDGKPIAGVAISLREPWDSAIYFPLPPSLWRTDVDGRFVMPGWEDDEVHGHVFNRDGYVSEALLARSGDVLDVALKKGGLRLSGRVRLERATEEPMFKRCVRVQRAVRHESGETVLVTLESLLPEWDRDGYAFAFSNLPEGELVLGIPVVRSRAKVNLEKDRDDVELVMDEEWLWLADDWREAGKARALHGRGVVLDLAATDGGAVPDGNLLVAIEPPGTGDHQDGNVVSHRFHRVKGGRIELPGLAPGTRVRVRSQTEIPGYIAEAQDFLVEAGAGVQRRAIKLSPAGAIRVEVRDEYGTPLIGARVVLTEADALSTVRSLENRDEFARSFKGVFGSVSLGGSRRVIATHGGRRVQSEPITLTAAKPVADVALRFYPAKEVVVRVAGPGDGPVAGTRLSVGRRDPGSENWDLASFRTNDEGMFRIEGLRRLDGVACDLHVTFDRDWQPVRTKFTGNEPEPWVLTVKPGLRLTGRVARADGGAVSGVRPLAFFADWENEAGERLPAAHAEEKTDAEGRFRFTNLPSGRLRFMVAGHAASRGMEFPVADVSAANAPELLIVVE